MGGTVVTARLFCSKSKILAQKLCRFILVLDGLHECLWWCYVESVVLVATYLHVEISQNKGQEGQKQIFVGC